MALYTPDFKRNFEWATENGLITPDQAERILAAGPLEDTKYGRIVVYEALGRRSMGRRFRLAPEYNVTDIIQHPVFNDPGDSSISIDTDIRSGSTYVPTESKFRKFSWKYVYPGQEHTALITAAKWDELLKVGGFLSVSYIDAWFLWEARKTEIVRESYMKAKRTNEDPYSEIIKKRQYELRFEDALLHYIK